MSFDLRGEGSAGALRSCSAMPWLVGSHSSWQVIGSLPERFALTDLLLSDAGGYAGYLLSGFEAALSQGRFRHERVPLALRAGWTAVAVTARTSDRALERAIGPFSAPTAPRPHAAAPLGFTLFSNAHLLRSLGPELERPRSSLEWAVLVNGSLAQDRPVFCDPVLELDLVGRIRQEQDACRYRPEPLWRGATRVLAALGRAQWRRGGLSGEAFP